MSLFSLLSSPSTTLTIMTYLTAITTTYTTSINSFDAADACLNKEGSFIKVRLIDDDSYPFVTAKCSNNGYLIIDINNDNNWKEYFSSNRLYHRHLMGPIRDDIVNWDEWFLVNNIEEYLVSPDCNSCNSEEILNKEYGISSSYYMMPAHGGCFQLPIGRIGCDMDYYSNECRICSTSGQSTAYLESKFVYNGLNNDKLNNGEAVIFNEIDSTWRYGLCGFTIRNAFAKHSMVSNSNNNNNDNNNNDSLLLINDDTLEHCKRVTFEDISDYNEKILPRRKPSIGTNGQFCVCAKPNKMDFYKLFEYQDISVIDSDNDNDIDNNNNEEEYLEIELYQEDFKSGTYRILEAGKYTIMEDIIFDFNAPDDWENGELDTYNGEGMWWPESGNDYYPGAGDLKDPFFMGFYAGISVECEDEKGVIIDLNGHSLSMSKAFFYQQNFFAIISLSGQIFLPGQGNAFFGADYIMSKNIEIKNGIIGLSSHHGIFGSFNENVYLHDLQITKFKTHGIQLSGFNNIRLNNIEVYENEYIEKLSPFYAHLRQYLPLHRLMVEDLKQQNKDNICIKFNNRLNEDFISKIYDVNYNADYSYKTDNNDDTCVTYSDMVDNIETLLDIAFEFAVFDKNEEEIVKDLSYKELKMWELNKDMIINDNRNYHAWTATLYGIFLNYQGSNVLGWYTGSESVKSYKVEMDNIYIHDLYHDTKENFGFSTGDSTHGERILNCLNAPINAYHVFGKENVELISECIMYSNENNNEKCNNFGSNMNYIGNILVDIQIMTFYLINKHDMSWDYCVGGAVDLNTLVEFAINGYDFSASNNIGPTILGSHDPMIHPGKGVLGLRLNGINKVSLSNININNIISDTKLGSLLFGKYESVISQQDPYMTGYSMNLAHGISITMSDEITLDNININNIKSATGYVYALAFWFESNIKILNNNNNNDNNKKSININNIIAGYKLLDDDNFINDIILYDEYYPNKKPQVCPFLLYDDKKYPLSISNNINQFSNLININCIHGYQACQIENDRYTKFEIEAIKPNNYQYHDLLESNGIYDNCVYSNDYNDYNNGVGDGIEIIGNDVSNINNNNNNNNVIGVNQWYKYINNKMNEKVYEIMILVGLISIAVIIIVIMKKCNKTEYRKINYQNYGAVTSKELENICIDNNNNDNDYVGI